jgi:hypothetical protein
MLFLDKVILEELRSGGATVDEIANRIARRVRDELERLRKEGKVVRAGHGRRSNEFVYSLSPIKRGRVLG